MKNKIEIKDKIEIKEIQYKDFGQCLKLKNSEIELIITTDVGPRIISFGFIGKENEFCETIKAEVPVGDEFYKFRGGHRLWHSPENVPRTYIPDNRKVNYKKIKNGVKLIQEEEPWVQIVKEMEIILEPKDNKVKIIHRLINKNAWAIEASVWPLSVMASGGKEVIPQNQRETTLLPNRVLTLWPYSKMNDKRVYWGEKYIVITQDTSLEYPFKLGIANEEGWAAYFNHNNLFIKRYVHMDGAIYPDYGVSYETFINEFMVEMETLSPLTKIEPGKAIEHIENWELYSDVELNSNDEEKIEKTLNKYI